MIDRASEGGGGMATATTQGVPDSGLEHPANPPAPGAAPAGDQQVLFSLARALHQAGLPAHRLEEMLGRVAARTGWAVETFAMPTGLILSAWRGDASEFRLFRLYPRPIHLERIRLLTEEVDQLAAGRIDPARALARIEQIHAATAATPWPPVCLGFGLSAAGFSVIFGGGPLELAVTILVGLVVGLVAVAFGAARGRTRRFELVAALLAGLIATLIDRNLSHFIHWIPIASGLVVCLPGMALVDAIEELANSQLVSGGARMAGVGSSFLALIFGVMLGVNLGELAGTAATDLGAETYPAWAVVPAVAVVSLGSVFRFNGRFADWPVIAVASAVALAGSRFGLRLGNPLLGPFAGALALSVLANLYARYWRPTPQLLLVPGLALLVPGSLGLRSLEALVQGDSSQGIEQGVSMFMMGMALVVGLLFGNPLTPKPAPSL